MTEKAKEVKTEAKTKEAEATEVKEVKTPAAAPKSQGSEIAEAIREATSGQKNFVIAADETVEPRFAVVKNKDGEVMIREEATGQISKVQLESIEEKQVSLQNQEVTKV